MESIQIGDAEAKFSALIDAAERGRPTIITRHGRPAWSSCWSMMRGAPEDRSSCVDLLLSFPGGLAFERDQTPRREVDH